MLINLLTITTKLHISQVYTIYMLRKSNLVKQYNTITAKIKWFDIGGLQNIKIYIELNKMKQS